MNKRIKKKIYNRAEAKLEAFRVQNADKRSYSEIARQENVLTPQEKTVFLAEQEKWIRITRLVLDEIETDEMKEKYETIRSRKDPEGFHLFHAAESILGAFDYAHFPYEDNRGYFEEANGTKLLQYLLVQYCWKLGKKNAEVNRWEIVASCYEQCINMEIDTTTPEYREFEHKLYAEVVTRLERN